MRLPGRPYCYCMNLVPSAKTHSPLSPIVRRMIANADRDSARLNLSIWIKKRISAAGMHDPQITSSLDGLTTFTGAHGGLLARKTVKRNMLDQLFQSGMIDGQDRNW
jgi:hypothetical protein